jgi:hypothetical protein
MNEYFRWEALVSASSVLRGLRGVVANESHVCCNKPSLQYAFQRRPHDLLTTRNLKLVFLMLRERVERLAANKWLVGINLELFLHRVALLHHRTPAQFRPPTKRVPFTKTRAFPHQNRQTPSLWKVNYARRTKRVEKQQQGRNPPGRKAR